MVSVGLDVPISLKQKFHWPVTLPVLPSMHMFAPKSCPGKLALERVELIDAPSAGMIPTGGGEGEGGGGEGAGGGDGDGGGGEGDAGKGGCGGLSGLKKWVPG